MPKRFSFPPGEVVKLHDPGQYTVTRLDDGSMLVEVQDKNQQESETKLKTETISEVSDE